jgi:hypothetical protein
LTTPSRWRSTPLDHAEPQVPLVVRSPLQAYGIGLIHGIGGSAGVGLLTTAAFRDPSSAEAFGSREQNAHLPSGLGPGGGEKGKDHRTTTSGLEWGVEMADESTEEQQDEPQESSEGAAGGSLAGAAKGAVAGAAAGAAVGAAVAALTGRKGQEPTSESENDETDESSGGVEDDDQSSEAEE